MENKRYPTNFLTKNDISEATKVSMKTRIISSIVAILIVLPCIFIGDWVFFGLIAAVLTVASIEITRCIEKKHKIILYVAVILFSLVMTYWPLLRGFANYITNQTSSITDWRLSYSFDNLYITIFGIAIMTAIFFFVVVIDEFFTVRDACFLITMIIVISLGFQALLYVRYLPQHIQYDALNNPLPDNIFNTFDTFQSSLLLIYVALATFLTDACAYFVGVFFGKTKMNPRISPKKTWEGFFGGVFLSAILSMAFAFTFACCDNPIIPLLDLDHWYHIVILGFGIPFIATLGDFVFSSIKRYYSIKDFGTIMPGHGGVLDRCDSIVFTFIFTALYLGIIYSLNYGTNILL